LSRLPSDDRKPPAGRRRFFAFPDGLSRSVVMANFKAVDAQAGELLG